MHRETSLNGNAPGIMEVYGSYGSSLDTGFYAPLLSLLDRGYVFLYAHVRGGQECGRAWYDAARGSSKQTTFDDTIACARYAVESKLVAQDALTLVGRSAGGLAVGAVLNQAPQCFSAAIADMPFVDVLNTMLDPTLPLTPAEWPEWGNPLADEDDFNRIASWSPYDNVTRQRYPALLVTAGLSDPRVGYWEPLKWVSRLRATATPGAPLLLHVFIEAGHFGSSGRYRSLADLAREFAFILGVDGRTRTEVYHPS